jgi:uncharacterized repeat protein (TIGR01451 family)
MKNVPLFRGLAVAALAALSFVAFAQSSPQRGGVEVRLIQNKVVAGPNGTEQLVAADRAAPGELIEYRATYTNRGTAPVRDLAATLPIPVGMVYVPGTLTPTTALASTGTEFAPIPLKRKMRQPDGREVETDVPVTDYRSLQWRHLELAPGQSVSVVARVRMDASPNLAVVDKRGVKP